MSEDPKAAASSRLAAHWQDKDLWRGVGEVFGAFSFVSTWTGCLLAVVIVQLLGGPLAQLLQLYAGNLSPREAAPSFSWPLVALLSAVPLWPAWKRRWTWASLACLPLLVLAGVEAAELFRLAGRDPTWE